MIQAGVDGRMGPFTLRAGDCVNPMLRPAGMLMPNRTRALTFKAGFGQIAAPVRKAGRTAEMAGAPRPFKVIPLVVIQRQGVFPLGSPARPITSLTPTGSGRPALTPSILNQSSTAERTASCLSGQLCSLAGPDARCNFSGRQPRQVTWPGAPTGIQSGLRAKQDARAAPRAGAAVTVTDTVGAPGAASRLLGCAAGKTAWGRMTDMRNGALPNRTGEGAVQDAGLGFGTAGSTGFGLRQRHAALPGIHRCQQGCRALPPAGRVAGRLRLRNRGAVTFLRRRAVGQDHG